MREPDDQFAFDRFRLDPSERLLFDGDTAVSLREKVFETLLFMVRNPGRLLTKEELIDAIWPDRHVEESNLNHNISVLRKTLGDSTEEPRFIQTVPKRGFRFIADVRLVETNAGAQPTRRAAGGDDSPDAGAATRKPEGAAETAGTTNATAPRAAKNLWYAFAAALALVSLTAGAWAVAARRGSGDTHTAVTVLPFRDLSPSPDRSYIATSLTETLANRLGSIGGIIVRPAPATPADLREIAQRLRVDIVVAGAVQSGSRGIRITAEVFDAKADANVWSRQFDVAPSDVLVVEDSIAQAIGDHIRPGLTADDRARLSPAHSRDAEADDAYVRGRDFLDRRVAIAESEQYLQRAVARDPQFAAAWAALAEAKMYPRPGSIDVQGAVEAAHRALRLDPSLAEAHAALGFIAFFYRWDWSGAERELRTAIQLNPGSARAHDWYALTLAVRGSMPAALAELDRARQIDPRSLDMATDAALLRLLAHDYSGAERAAREVLAMDPSETQARGYRIAALLKLKRFDEAIAESAAQTEETPAKEVSREIVRFQAGRAIDRSRIVAEVAQLESADLPPEHLASLYARLGEREKALQLLVRACERHSFGVVFAANNDDFENVRDDPRFTSLLRRLGVMAGTPVVASMTPGRGTS